MQQRHTVIADEPRAVPLKAAAQSATTPMVVVAEDDDELRMEICAVLQQDGFAVVPFTDGEGLIGFLGTCELSGRSPDLIISDHFMPGYTGLDVLHALSESGWATPVILISGYGDQDLAISARAHGAKAYFKKPLDLMRVRSAVYACIDWSNRRLGGIRTPPRA